jgi:hypothetical protein
LEIRSTPFAALPGVNYNNCNLTLFDRPTHSEPQIAGFWASAASGAWNGAAGFASVLTFGASEKVWGDPQDPSFQTGYKIGAYTTGGAAVVGAAGLLILASPEAVAFGGRATMTGFMSIAPHVVELPEAAEAVFAVAEQAEAISIMNETAVAESLDIMSQMSRLMQAGAAPPFP